MSATSGSLIGSLSSVLLDTSAFFAFFDQRDTHHQRVTEILRSLNEQRIPAVLTNHIRAETHALILNRRGHYYADQFLAQVRTGPPGSLIFATEADEERALAIVARYSDKDFSLVDAISFVIMERLGITHVVTLDRNFQQYGFAVL